MSRHHYADPRGPGMGAPLGGGVRGYPDQVDRGRLTVGHFNVEPRASQSSDDSGVRLACQKPNPTRTAITKAKTNAAMAAQKAMVPITEKA